MAYTQTDLDNIKAAIATGTLSTEIEGIKVTYRSLAEMLAIKAVIEREVAPPSTSRTTTYTSFSRG